MKDRGVPTVSCLLLSGLFVSCTERRSTTAAAFVERTDTGIDFRHQRCGCGDKHLIEMGGGAAAVLDYDLDGRLDLFFAQSAPLPKFDATGIDLRDRLFRGESAWHYVDVTDAAHCNDATYTFSASAADYDGDGDPDLYLANWGPDHLLRNDHGVFSDVSNTAGIHDDEWSSCAAFADFDRDGDLDLYIGNYVIYDLENPVWCGDRSKGPEYRVHCHPDTFKGQRDRFYRNNGDGTFADLTKEAGLWDSNGKALGLAICDFDDDGDVDLYVANDSTPNFLWRNDGDLKFTEVAFEMGCAVGENGKSQGSMGVDWSDVDGDGDFDVAVTNFGLEMITLYRNDRGLFTYDSYGSGLGPPSLQWVGFGARFVDVDNDGDEDFAVANGHVMDNIHLYRSTMTFEQPAQLFWSDGHGHFTLAGAEAGPYFAECHVGRATASFDPDNDGDQDLVYVNSGGGAVLLENRLPPGRHWIGFTLHGADRNTAAIGARITISAAGHEQTREQRCTCSYNASNDPRVHFGLDAHAEVDWAEVRWPRGQVHRLTGLKTGHYVDLHEPGAILPPGSASADAK